METEAGSTLKTRILLFAGATLLFAYNLGFPLTHNFDEFHYIPSAKQFLALTENQNYEHPPLGKELIAIGVGLIGDHPIGWRIMSVLFGALTLLGIHELALVLFGSARAALVASLVTLFNQMLFVQARIAMLDTFMAAFLVWSWAWGLAGWRSRSPRLLSASGVMIGFAVASKWFALVPWAAMWGLAAAALLLEGLGSPKKSIRSKKSRPVAGVGPSWRQLALSWGLVPVLAYYATFIPFLFITRKDGGSYGLWDILFSMQYAMWDGQMRVVSPHSYGSHWWQWPLMHRPMWYAFDRGGDAPGFVRGVMLLGSPVVLWGGILGVGYTAWDWLKRRRPEALLLVSGWAVCTFSWALIPRKLAFFYYYYPAVLWLGLACTYAVEHATPEPHRRLARLSLVALCLLFFIHFYPILAALPIEPDAFMKWMWFRSWV
jgi:dolichyl-phosphate-mannose-protein mannosyltransferase